MTEERQQSAMFGLFARELIANGRAFRFCAAGRSMWPTIDDGDILYIQSLSHSPRLGDIVLFLQENRFKAHRIVGVSESHFVTRGDAGMENDGVVRNEEIIGKVVAKQRGCDGRIVPLGEKDRIRFFTSQAKRFAARQLRRWSASLLISCLVLGTLVLPGTLAWSQSIGGVALDNTNSQGFQTGTASCPLQSGTTYICSFSHTTNSIVGSTGLLVVGVSMNTKSNSGSSITGVTYNGASMAQQVSRANGNFNASMWALSNPPVGTFTLAVTINKTGGNVLSIFVGAMTLYNVDLTGTITTANGGGSGTLATTSTPVSSGPNAGVIDTLAAEISATSVTPGTGQSQQWFGNSGTTAQDIVGASSSTGGAASVSMQETLSPSSAWAMVAISVPALNPTAAKVNSFTATGQGSIVELAWTTGAEIHNLGYNVYRDRNGTRTQLNPSLIAGSALLTREALPQHGARSYGWVDPAPVSGALYWLEDVDLNGTRTMHGPVSVESTTVVSTRAMSPSLGAFAGSGSQVSSSVGLQPTSASHVLERMARPRATSSSAQNMGFHLAAKPGIKILVDHEGWYRVTQPQLVTAGLRSNASGNLLHLYAEGVEQPIRVTGGGTFGPQSAIEFYGTAIDTPYSGQRVYWLVEQGRPGLRIPDISPSDSATPQSPSFIQTLELKPRSTYFAALLRDNTDNFFGPLVTPTPDIETIKVADCAGGEATLSISLQGVTTGQQHDVTVMLNDSTLGDVSFSDQQEGRGEFTVPVGVLTNGANSITLTAQQGTNDISLVDTITLSFAHTYTAESDLLKFNAEAGQNISVHGFKQLPSRLVDITDPLRPMELRFSSVGQGGTYTLHSSVPWTTSGQHTLLALSDLRLSSPVSIVPHAPTRLHTPQQGAAFVIITAPQFSEQFQPLAALHEAEGTRSAVINVGDIYDEFNFGEPSPLAVKAFLRNATAAWTSRPRYLVLGGDASVDPRNYLGFGFFDFVPTKIVPTSQLKTASDDWFSDFNNAGYATIATGRLAARTAADAQLMVSKIVGYASGTLGSWNSQALLVADADDPGTSFTQAAQSVQELLPSNLNADDIFAGKLGTQTANQDLLSGINNGQLLVNYNGHGSIQVWASGGLFDDTMAGTLSNGSRLPLFVIMNCLNGFFHDVYTQSLAESLMLAPNGGAVAVWASSGLTNAEPQFVMNDRFIQTLFSRPAPALGDAVLTAKSGVSDIDVRRTFIFFGDPAMRLRAPQADGTKSGTSSLPASISQDQELEH